MNPIKILLYRVAWTDLGIPMSTKSKKYLDLFLKSHQFEIAKQTYWENPLLERGGVPDDMTTQKYHNHLKEEFLNFVVERFDYDAAPQPLERGYNGETTS